MPYFDRQRGFTIVEVLIAGAIIAIGILAWAKAHDSGIKNRAISSDISIAAELATAKMETLSLEIQKWSSSHTEINKNATITLQGVTYYQDWEAKKGRFFDEGNPVWEITARVKWSRYGPKSVEYQKIVVGR